MANMCCFTGRVFKEPKLKKRGPNGEKECVRFTLGVKREYRERGNYRWNFVRCVCYIPDKIKYIQKAFEKGIYVSVECEFYSENYEDDHHVWHEYWEFRVRDLSFGVVPIGREEMLEEAEPDINW